MFVIADDLTGAADSAGVFATAGFRCSVLLNANRESLAAQLAVHDYRQVIVFDTDSRGMSSADASAATLAATAVIYAVANPPDHLFVKVDSTLRGHVRVTVDAVLSSLTSPPSRVVVCPAFPTQGRTVVDGRVCVDGVPIGAPNLRELFANMPGARRVEIPDIATAADMAGLVAAAEPDTVWVGSAGLASHLASHLASYPAGSEAGPIDTIARVRASRVVVVAGSLQDRTAQQITHLDADTRVVVDNPSTRSFRAAVEAATVGADGLVLTGGATARAVLEILGVHTLHVGGEVEPGVPWSLASGRHSDIGIVTKAGGFGGQFTLRNAVAFLRGA